MTDAIAAVATAASNAGCSAAAAGAIDAAAAWQALHADVRTATAEAFALSLSCPDVPAWAEAFRVLHDRLVVALEQSDERADLVSLWLSEPPADAV
jgi:hypothetical protein